MARFFVTAALLVALVACASLPAPSSAAGFSGRRLLQPKQGPDCRISAGPCDLETADPVRCCGCGGDATCGTSTADSSSSAPLNIDALPGNITDAMKACNNGTAPPTFNSTTIAALPKDDMKDSWPELACQPGEVAVAYIKQQNAKLSVDLVKPGSATVGLDMDHVFVFLKDVMDVLLVDGTPALDGF